jgi:hypothetical protein
MFCLRGYWSPSLAPVREGPVRHHIKFNSVVVSLIYCARMRYAFGGLELAERSIMVPTNCDRATGLWCQGTETEISPCVENS